MAWNAEIAKAGKDGVCHSDPSRSGANQAARRVHWLYLGCVVSALTLIFAWNYNFMLVRFFQRGELLFDTAFIGSLIHEPTLRLGLPTVLREANEAPTYYAIHFSPIFLLLGIPNLLFRTNFITSSAIFFAIQPVLVGASLALALWQLRLQRRLSGRLAVMVLLTFAAPLVFAFAGPTLHVVEYPHYELLFVPFAASFFVFVIRRNFVAATVALLLCVFTREDFAFHLFGFTFAWVAYQGLIMREPTRTMRPWLVYLAILAAAGGIILTTQRLYFPGDDALARIYLGSPAYAHVTPDLLVHRIAALISWRRDLLMCVASAIALSALFRDWRYVLGYVACAPWLVFNMLAKSDAAGTLTLHYGFPLVLAMMWPILVLTLPAGPPAPRVLTWHLGRRTPTWHATSSTIIVVTLAGFLGSTLFYSRGQALRLITANTHQVPTHIKAAVLGFQELILKGVLDRERIGVDQSVASLAPAVVRYGQVVRDKNFTPYRALAFYAWSLHSSDFAGEAIAEGFSNSLRIGASPIFVVAKSVADAERLKTRLAIESGGALALFEQSFVFERMTPGAAGERAPTFMAIRETIDGVVMSGPFIKLPAGAYRIEYSATSDCGSPARGQFNIVVRLESSRTELARTSVQADEMFSPQICAATIGTGFSITNSQTADWVTIDLAHSGAGRYTVDDARIVRVHP